jgi:hypothetical protein
VGSVLLLLLLLSLLLIGHTGPQQTNKQTKGPGPARLLCIAPGWHWHWLVASVLLASAGLDILRFSFFEKTSA